ncbi:MAG: NGG1p interacting factor NIF3 [Actinomycetota bacterium]|nr:NGG1p interacting factor NIF3 [Actinomycetota bacterium]
MKLGEIYRFAVELGIKKDPRGSDEVKGILREAKKEYEALKGKEKEFFDKEKLSNPFADTRILYGEEDTEVKSLIAGIDVESPELILVDRLREKGLGIDLCVSHHPEGRALASLADVMGVQADVWAGVGVPVNVGDALIAERMNEVRRSLLPQNHRRAVDVARLLDIPFMCIHTAADNLVTDYLTRLLKRKKPKRVGEAIDLLLEEEEYRIAAREGTGPTLLVGDKKSRAGEFLVDMTGGTEGPPGAIEKLSQAGIGTIVAMHMGDKLRKEAEKLHVNVIIAGHIASDNIGINLLLDGLEDRGVATASFSGLERVRRNRKKASLKKANR